MKNLDYQFSKLIKINVKNKPIQMYVQPRFIDYFVNNNYEEFTVDKILHDLNNEDVFIDIGSHYGYYSLLAAKLNKKVKVISFEPVEANYRVFKKNISLNRISNINTYPYAISDKNGDFDFKLSDASDSSGFYGHPLTPTIKIVKVKTKKLDDFIDNKIIDKIKVIKIDTEGHEIEVLKGMNKIIKKNAKIKFFIEFNPKCLVHAGKKPEDLLVYLEKIGFNTYAIDDKNKKLNFIDKNNWLEFVDYKKYINIMAINKDLLEVLFFSHTAGLGGSERSLLELIDELQELNVVCHAVLPYEGPLSEELKRRAIDYEIIGYHWWCSQEKLSKEGGVRQMNESFANLMKKKEILDRWNVDIIFTNTLAIPWGLQYARLTNKPHITFIREFGDLDFNLNFFNGYKESLDFINDNSNFVFTNSKATLLHFKKYIDVKKIDYAYTYINIDKIFTLEKVKKIFKNKASLKLVISGAIIPSKGHKDAILAVAELVKKGQKDIELLIIGTKHDESFSKELNIIIKKNKISENVKFVDFVKNPFPYICQADVLLMCSKNEAYGRVTIEGMILKKPIIGTNSGATKELISNNFNGLLYKNGDYVDLANKIKFFFENRSELKKFGNNGYAYYKNTFSKINYGAKVLKIMTKIVNKKKLDNSFFSASQPDFNSTYKSEIVPLISRIKDLENKQHLLIKENNSLNISLTNIYSSKTWRLLFLYKRIVNLFKKYFVK